MTHPSEDRPADAATARIYDELRQLARRRLAQGLGGASLQATALVHEVWIRLAEDPGLRWRDEAHFHALAAQAMRWVLVDQARRRRAHKRRGTREERTLSGLAAADADDGWDALALDEALDALHLAHPRKAQVVMLRHFAGLSVEEVALELGLSKATVKREWAFARAWLLRRLGEESPGEDSRDG